jgi:hypothetical protein
MPIGKNLERLEIALPKGGKAALADLAELEHHSVKSYAEKVILDHLRDKGVLPLPKKAAGKS